MRMDTYHWNKLRMDGNRPDIIYQLWGGFPKTCNGYSTSHLTFNIINSIYFNKKAHLLEVLWKHILAANVLEIQRLLEFHRAVEFVHPAGVRVTKPLQLHAQNGGQGEDPVSLWNGTERRVFRLERFSMTRQNGLRVCDSIDLFRLCPGSALGTENTNRFRPGPWHRDHWPV